MALCPDGHQSDATDYCDVCGLSMGAGTSAAAPAYGSGQLANTLAMPLGEPCPNCLLPRTDDPFCEGCGFDFANQAPVAVPTAAPVYPAPTAAPTAAPAPAPTAPIDIEEQLRLAEEAARAAARGGSQNTVTPALPTPAPAAGDPLSQGTATPPPAAAGTGRWVLLAVADRDYYDAVVADGEIDPDAYPFPPYCPERRFEVTGSTVRIGRSGKRGTVEIDLTGPPTDPGVSHLNSVLQTRPDGGWTVLDPGSTNGTVLNDDTAPIPHNQAVPVESGFRIHVGVWTTLTLIRE